MNLRSVVGVALAMGTLALGAFTLVAPGGDQAAPAIGSTASAIRPAAFDSAFTVGAVTNNCGIATCSTYISRSGTKSLDRFLDGKVAQYGSWGAEAIVCTSLGEIPYVGVPLGLYCGFRFVQFDQVLDEAADKNKCFKVTYLPTGTVTHISTNNGQYCKN